MKGEPDNMQRLLGVLAERAGMTCSEIGQELWGPHPCRQAYARAAGVLTSRAVESGLVRRGYHDGRPVFYLIRKLRNSAGHN